MTQVKGNGSTRQPTIASVARNVSQNTENLYNAELVDWAFEDASIQASKIIGGVTPALHATTHSDGGTDEITVENLATGSANTAYALKPNGTGGLVFGSVGGVAAIDYDTTYTNSLVSTNAVVEADYSIAIGLNANSKHLHEVVIGRNINTASDATSPYGGAVLIGNNIEVNAQPTHDSIGMQIGIGYRVRIHGDYGIAIGGWSTAGQDGYGGVASIAIGYGATSWGDYGVVIGYSAQSVTLAAVENVVIGNGAKIRAGKNVIIGSGAGGNDVRTNTVAIGYNATAGNNGVSIGYKIAAAASTVRLGIDSTNHFTFAGFSLTAETPTTTHTIPVQVNGNSYKLLLST